VTATSTQVSLINSDIDSLLSLKSDVKGVAADGAAHILLLMKTNKQSVTFGPLKEGDGCFFFITQAVPKNCDYSPIQTITVLPEYAGSGSSNTQLYAKVGYIAPSNFSSTKSTTDTTTTRTVNVVTDDPDLSYIPVMVVRPPLYLLHGLWSDSSTWSSIGPGLPPLFYKAADYRASNAQHIKFLIPIMWNDAENTLETFRESFQVAASQLDFVGHSMGGLITRGIASKPTYRRQENYLNGLVHKMITIGTPYDGSPFAKNLVAEFDASDGCVIIKKGFAVNGLYISGAVRDLAQPTTVSVPHNVPMHAIVGVAGSDTEKNDENWVGYLALAATCSHMNLNLFGQGYHPVFGEDSDLIVGASSQHSGFPSTSWESLSGAIHLTNDFVLFPFGIPELQYSGLFIDGASITERLISLLNTSIADSAYYTVP